ncbi:MAG: PspA-associated protein PspAB [Ferrimicrobium sp.]
MGFLDSLLGKTKPVRANLDQLFALSTASISLTVSANLDSTNTAGVVFKPASGAAFANTEQEFQDVLATMADEGTSVHLSTDSFGYRWVNITTTDLESLVTAAHLVNRSLEDHGFSPQLLCSVFAFTERPSGQQVYWIYLYKRGTYYPFVPTGPERRDNEKELSLKAVVGSDLPVESEITRWFPLWEIPI